MWHEIIERTTYFLSEYDLIVIHKVFQGLEIIVFTPIERRHQEIVLSRTLLKNVTHTKLLIITTEHITTKYLKKRYFDKSITVIICNAAPTYSDANFEHIERDCLTWRLPYYA